MVEYRTDEERVQLILDYFNQYKLAIISFLLFVIISVSGYFYVCLLYTSDAADES